jgi:hypothetical protein
MGIYFLVFVFFIYSHFFKDTCGIKEWWGEIQIYRYFCVKFFLFCKFPIKFVVEKTVCTYRSGKDANLTLLHSEFVEREEDNRTDEISSFNRFTCVHAWRHSMQNHRTAHVSVICQIPVPMTEISHSHESCLSFQLVYDRRICNKGVRIK